MHKSPLVAVDTNFPLQLAGGDDEALEALHILEERLQPAAVLVPPTVLGELIYLARADPGEELRQLANITLRNLRSRWRIQPAALTSPQEGIVAEAVQRLRERNIVPYEERNDAAIIAESAALNSILLVSNDSHLLRVDHRQLGLLFRELDLPVPIIASPRELVKKFYR